MKKNIVFLLLCGALLLSGCGLLRREYSRTEPHSATYYEGDRRDVLRAESYQDLVNDLLLLVAAHAEEGTVWYYAEEETDLSREAQRACAEVQQETPLGAYALDYLTYTVDDGGRGYTQLRFTAGYRRTLQQIQSIVHATGGAALTDLLRAAAQNGGKELVVQMGTSGSTRQAVLDTVNAVQADLHLADRPWQVQFTRTPTPWASWKSFWTPPLRRLDTGGKMGMLKIVRRCDKRLALSSQNIKAKP